MTRIQMLGLCRFSYLGKSDWSALRLRRPDEAEFQDRARLLFDDARLAARFAAKEAAIKAFSRPDAPFVPLEIEVVSSGSVPTLNLTGRAAALADEQGWQEVCVSMTHAECHAAAVVAVVCRESPVALDTEQPDNLDDTGHGK